MLPPHPRRRSVESGHLSDGLSLITRSSSIFPLERLLQMHVDTTLAAAVEIGGLRLQLRVEPPLRVHALGVHLGAFAVPRVGHEGGVLAQRAEGA